LTPTSSATQLIEILLAGPGAARQQWLAWRVDTKLDELDAKSLALMPLLSARIPDWLSNDPDSARILGICRRGWAENQLRLRELADVWKHLQQNGAAPVAIGGEAALSLTYTKERSVRTITTLEVFLMRTSAALACELLQATGWTLEPHNPFPEGRVLDQYQGVWLRSQSPAALHLRWRLADVPPALAADHEASPATRNIDLQGTSARTFTPEALLIETLTRPSSLINWQCDANILLRNEQVDWKGLHQNFILSQSATEKLHELRHQTSLDIPETPLPNENVSRLKRWHNDYRNVAWESNQPTSTRGFTDYIGYRARIVLTQQSNVTLIDARGISSASSLGDYARYRTLFLFLAARDIRLRYRKTWRGVVWALVQPLLPMALFAAIFARVLRPELSLGPYWLFVLSGIAPWMFFSSAVNYASATFISNANLLNKIYFPRGILPAAAVAACLLDLLVSSTALVIACLTQHHAHSLRLLELPLAMIAATLIALIFGVAAASLNVLYRDLKPLVPFLLQVAMYATPILYPLTMVPARLRWIAWLNPMTAVVEAFHSALFRLSIDWRGTSISAFATFIIVIVTALLFRSVEADIAERA
jgi:lipopolysaccharide transport system permease protein